MKRDEYSKLMFVVAALWNWAATLVFMSLVAFNLEAQTLFLNVIPESFLWFYLFFGIVAVLGLGYFWTSRDVSMNRNIVKMGIVGKIWVVLLIGWGWLTGVVTVLAVCAVAIDLLFAILFIEVLLRIKKRDAMALGT